MSKTMIFLAYLLCIALCGCATTTYTFNGVNYSSSSAALDSQRSYCDGILKQILPTNNHVGGRVLMVLPSRYLIEKNGITITGSKSRLSRDTIEYVVSSSDMVYQFMADALRNRNIFNEVTVKRDDQPEQYVLPGYDAVIYLYLLTPQQAQWFFKIPEDNKKIPIHADESLSPGVPRTISWLDSIERIAIDFLKFSTKKDNDVIKK